MVKPWPAGAARHLVSNAMFLATTETVVPFGWQVAAGVLAGPAVGNGDGEYARASPCEDGWASSRFWLTVSYHAIDTVFPSGVTARLGFAPPRLSGRTSDRYVPPGPAQSWIWSGRVSAQAT